MTGSVPGLAGRRTIDQIMPSVGAALGVEGFTNALGLPGFQRLADSTRRSTEAILHKIAGIRGLRVVGEPAGPLLAVATDPSAALDERVDPHHWADAARGLGFILQLQPAAAGIPPTTHLTITPVTEKVLPELLGVLAKAADAVRGVPHVDVSPLLGQLPPLDGSSTAGPLDSDTAAAILGQFGIGAGGALPDALAPLLAIIEATPPPLAERLLTELLARLVEPPAPAG